ncbi:MAG: ferrochelatase [Candidatus Krumholzibacteriia bacterium]
MRFAPPLQPAVRLHPDRRIGLLYLGLGGPDGEDSVAPFLRNLFADPMVLPLPAWLSGPLGRIIVARRVDEVRAKYRGLGFGGGSPQLDWSERQAAQLAALLAERGLDVVPAVAMRYWHPFTDEALAALRDAGAEQLLVVPTYPQYSVATTGSSLRELDAGCARVGWRPPRHVLREWPLLTGYIELLSRQAARVLVDWQTVGHRPEQCALVYTAHSLPERFHRGGDAYVRQTRATVTAAHRRLAGRLSAPSGLARLAAGGTSPLLAFQSKVGPVKWIGPPTEATCLDLVRGGVRHLGLVPVSFNCEHIETLDELDRELGDAVRAAGAASFVRTAALNLDPGWLRSFADRLAYRAFGLAGSAEVTHG